VTTTDIHGVVEAVWRIESPRLVAGLMRIVRDVGVAEDLGQDALVAALEQWPKSGVPDNPGAWLMATAKHRAIDLFRRNIRLDRKHEELSRELSAREMTVPDLNAALDDDVGDDLLRLLFISCHPVLSREAQVALTLRLLGGLTTIEIARAFLLPEATVAQRIVRAKRTLAQKRVPFEVPCRDELAARLSSVLEVIYLIFNEGYSATSGADWMRPALCKEALRLGRVLAELIPQEPEVHGLIALIEIQSSRSRARVGPSGEPVLLFDQNRTLWDQLLIRRGLAALVRANKLGSARGTYLLQAEIAACHARAHMPEETDWPRIVTLYEALCQLESSPVVELNRAVAVAMVFGPAAGLELVDALAADRSLQNYHLLPSVRGDLLKKLSRIEEARAEFERAASFTRNARERSLLLERAQACMEVCDDELRQFEAEGAAPLPATNDQGYVEHAEARIWYTAYGSGSPVLLLHGGLGHSGNWGYQVPALVGSGFRVVLMDSRGHGRSTRDARPYTYELMASDVLAVMDALHIQKASFVGWSDGACTALILGARAPERVAGVFFFACNMDPSGVKPIEDSPILNRCFGRHANDYVQLAATPNQFKSLVEAVSHMQRTQPNYSAQDLAGITVPVTIVQSEYEEFIKREHAEYLARSIPNAELVALNGVSHFAPLQRPEQFNAAMLSFLGKVRP
jgi:RNA polymerase sigma-70 factor, ECF subfamily